VPPAATRRSELDDGAAHRTVNGAAVAGVAAATVARMPAPSASASKLLLTEDRIVFMSAVCGAPLLLSTAATRYHGGMFKLPTDLDELVTLLASLPDRPAIERAAIVRSIPTTVRAILGDIGEAAIFEAVHELDGMHKRTHREVGAALGVTPSTINEAITRYRKRHGGTS